MTSRDFCYWLQGYFEIAGTTALTAPQAEMVKRHLALVFKHEIDPPIGGNAADLQEIHDGANDQQYCSPAEIPSRPPFSATDTLVRC